MSFDNDLAHHRSLRQLLERQNKYPNYDSSPLVSAATNGDLEKVKSLLESGKCNINETIDKGVCSEKITNSSIKHNFKKI